jgi:hypothetical protein
VFAKRKFNFYIAMSKNKSGAFQGLQFRAFMSGACVKNVLLLLVLSLTSVCLKAQDSLVFRNLKTEAVTVLSVSDGEVKYQKYGDQSGEVRFAKTSDLFHIRYENGRVHRFSSYGSDRYSYKRKNDGFKKYTGQFDFYFRDAWGVGLMLRRELNPYVGINLAGASYMSGWGRYDGPSSAGFINIRALGVRLYTPRFEPCRLYAEVTPGYTHFYVDTYIPIRGGYRGTVDCFGLDFSAGIELGKHLALGYNLHYMVNSDGSATTHWAKFSVLF